MVVERGKIREYARSVASTHEAHDRADAVIPPTFLTVATNFWASEGDLEHRKDLDFDLPRVLHGSEEYEFPDGPPRAGDVLSVSTVLGDRWQRSGRRGGTMRFAELITEFRDGTGRVVAIQRRTLIETETPPNRP